MASELQDRIARAISGAPFSTPNSRRKALAVMKAMREPNARMLAAAQTAWLNDPARRTSTLWQAMLDAEIAAAEVPDAG